jgi:chromosome segregation ATPase
MAARQDQTLFLINIFCIVIALLLAVGTYLGFKGKSEVTQQLDSASKSLQDTQTQVRNLAADNDDLRAKIGIGLTDSRQALQDAFDVDMKKYLSGDQPYSSYRLAFANLDDCYRKAAAEEAGAKAQVVDLTNKLTSLEQVKEAQIAAVDGERKKAVDSAAVAMSQFNQDRADIDAKLQQLTQTLGTQSTAYEQQIAARNSELEQLKTQVARQQTTITQLTERLKPDAGTFEVADGLSFGASQP